jgi:hypothetical protein
VIAVMARPLRIQYAGAKVDLARQPKGHHVKGKIANNNCGRKRR